MSEIEDGRLGLYGTKHSKRNHLMTLGFKGLTSHSADKEWIWRGSLYLLPTGVWCSVEDKPFRSCNVNSAPEDKWEFEPCGFTTAHVTKTSF